MADERLTIGELASRTGVATSALRYWEDVGLLPPPARVSGGRRRYSPATVPLVGEILVLQDVGYSLREIKAIIDARSSVGQDWRELFKHKLTELDDQIARAQAARTAIAKAVVCPHHDIHECPSFIKAVTARLPG